MAPSESHEQDASTPLSDNTELGTESIIEGDADVRTEVGGEIDSPINTEGDAEPAEIQDDEEEEPLLKLEVDIQKRSTCERHIVVKVSRSDIDRYFNQEFSDLVTTAHVPGFRPGRAPRKLIERRFRKEVAERVKTTLLLDSIEQINEKFNLAPISEPKCDIDAVELPDEGPMTYEFDIEVRPEFELPPWKGLTIKRPVQEFTDRDVDEGLRKLLSRYGQLEVYDGPAEMGDYISTSLTFTCEGQQISSSPEELIRIRPVLTFRDGKIENFGEVMVGVRAGETRTAETVLSPNAPNRALRGKTIIATFEVAEVKRLKVPELDPQILQEIGDFKDEGELRAAIRKSLDRQLEHYQRRMAREQIAAALTASADWELPPDLLRRQAERELDRAVMELERDGFSEAEIRAFENNLQQNIYESTAKALKEHFILERIAEEEQIEASEEDYDEEIALIAEQRGESPRRIRAQLEKSGRMDVLRNQIIERKVIDLILQHAQFVETPFRIQPPEAEAIDYAAGGEDADSESDDADIPEATPETESEQQS